MPEGFVNQLHYGDNLVRLRGEGVDKAIPDEIATGEFTRSEVVWWFLALLELIRLGQAMVTLKDGDVRFKRQ